MGLLTGMVGRIIFCLPFIGFGLGHILMGPSMEGMVPLPGKLFWNYLVGVCLLGASISIILDRRARTVSLLLALLLLIIAVSIHWQGAMSFFQGNQSAMGSYVNFLKDIGLAGAALINAGRARE